MTQTQLTQPTARPRAIRRVVLAPLALGIGIIIGLLLLALPITPNELAIVSTMVFLCLCASPLLLVLFFFFIVLVVLNYYLAQSTFTTAKQTRRAHNATSALKARTNSLTEQVNQKTVELGAKVGRLDVIFQFFDRSHRKRKK